MDKHTTLNLLLKSLLDNNNLHNWSIFEDKSEFINVRIRFTKCENTNTVNNNVSYRRVSDSQARRNQDRAARHRAAGSRMQTRSQAVHASPEMQRSSEEDIYNSEPAPMPPVTQESVQGSHETDTGMLSLLSPDGRIISADTDDESTENTSALNEPVSICDHVIVNAEDHLSYHDQLCLAPLRSKLLEYLTDSEHINKDCSICGVQFEETFNREKRRMMQCQLCQRYICANCYGHMPMISKHDLICTSRHFIFIT